MKLSQFQFGERFYENVVESGAVQLKPMFDFLFNIAFYKTVL